MSNETATAPAAEPVPVDAALEEKRRRRMIILIIIVALLLALIAGAFLWYIINRKPLSQIPVFGQAIPPSFSFAMYDVSQPLGVAVDEANNRVYVTQSDGDRKVVVFDLDGNMVGNLEPPAAVDIDLPHTPVYVAVDPTTSEVYVSDRGAATVYVYDATGTYERKVVPKGLDSWQPLAVLVDGQGNLYASDVSDPDQRIVELAKDGSLVRTLGEKDDLQFPNGLALLADGSLAVADSNNGRVLLYAPTDGLTGAVARGTSDAALGLPRGLAVDDGDRLYVVDTSGQNVRVYLPGDEESANLPIYSFSFGEEGRVDGTFEYPNDVAVDGRGRVYITDRENNRVQVWSY